MPPDESARECVRDYCRTHSATHRNCTQAVDGKREERVINGTGHAAHECDLTRRELGQWGDLNRAADPMLATPDRPEALILVRTTGKGPDVMMSWLSAIGRTRNVVSSRTILAGV
jgi:hypothetical protein